MDPSADHPATWAEFEAAAPELAARVAGRFAANRHHVLATVRRDGRPRATGIEVSFLDGEVWLGMMPGSRKAADLRRDPRLALHSAPLESDLADGDAVLTGRAVELTDPAEVAAYLRRVSPAEGGPTEAVVFRVALEEVSLTRVAGSELVIVHWRAGRQPVEHRRR
jgi:nitroimidazol reductase NimA-like FMN-containing flavoprotein (pyridoxamine 5'-phosphate oxidase superfamily)